MSNMAAAGVGELAKLISDANGGAAVYISVVPPGLPEPIESALVNLHSSIGELAVLVRNEMEEGK